MVLTANLGESKKLGIKARAEMEMGWAALAANSFFPEGGKTSLNSSGSGTGQLLN